MRSLLSNPWALITRGGTVPGNRPATRIALLITKTGDGDYLGRIKSKARGAPLSKTDRPVDAGTILARFSHEPSAADIRAAIAKAEGRA